MKLKYFIIFISTVLIIYISVNYFIYISGTPCFFGVSSPCTILFYCIFIFFMFLYSELFTERKLSSSLINKIITLAGSLWLAAMLYFFLLLILFNLFKLIFGIFPGIPAPEPKTKLFFSLLVIITVLLTIIAGHINSKFTKIINLKIHIPKKAGDLKRIHIVAVSDIHLGTLVSEKK